MWFAVGHTYASYEFSGTWDLSFGLRIGHFPGQFPILSGHSRLSGWQWLIRWSLQAVWLGINTVLASQRACMHYISCSNHESAKIIVFSIINSGNIVFKTFRELRSATDFLYQYQMDRRIHMESIMTMYLLIESQRMCVVRLCIWGPCTIKITQDISELSISFLSFILLRSRDQSSAWSVKLTSPISVGSASTKYINQNVETRSVNGGKESQA